MTRGMTRVWWAQIKAVIRLEMKKTFFAKRGLWIYLVAALPVLLFIAYAIATSHQQGLSAGIARQGERPLAYQDLLANQVDMMFDNIPGPLGLMRSGKVRGLAVTSKERHPAAPEIPTMAEFLPGFEASSWFGLLAPAGTPPAVIARINTEVNQWLQTAEAKEKLVAQGAVVAGGTPEQFAAHIRAETEKWAKVVKVSGAKVD